MYIFFPIQTAQPGHVLIKLERVVQMVRTERIKQPNWCSNEIRTFFFYFHLISIKEIMFLNVAYRNIPSSNF